MDRVCHFEIPYGDKGRATRFYQSVFGWQIADAPGEMPYSFAITTPVDDTMMPSTPGGINGGMYPRGEGSSPSPVIVIQVDSTAQRIKDVQAAGGTHVLGPHEIPGMGIYGQVKDPEGNTIGLWQPAPCEDGK